MRLRLWCAGVIVVVALFAGVVSVVANHLAPSRAVTASSQVAGASSGPVGANGSAQLRMIARPSPFPSPTAAPRVVASPVHQVSSAPRPPIVIGSTQQVLINRDRAAYGLPPLTWSSCLYSVAARNAARISTEGTSIAHANGVYQDLACGLGRQSGENIGWWSGGLNDVQLNAMFMASPDHRANILGPYHFVASAWVVPSSGPYAGYGYIAVELS